MTEAHHTFDPDSPRHAEEQLAALQATSERSSTMQTRSQNHFAKFATVLALLVGAAHTIPTFFSPAESLPAFLIAMAAWVIVLFVLITWYLRGRSATPAGGNRRYLIGLLGTFVLYGLAALLWPHDNWFIAVLAGLVIALPLIIATWWKRT